MDQWKAQEITIELLRSGFIYLVLQARIIKKRVMRVASVPGSRRTFAPTKRLIPL